MIRLIKVMALLAAIAGVGALSSAPASANGYIYGHHHHHGHYRLHHHGFPFAYGIARILGAFLPHPHHYHVPVYPRRCHRVTKTAYHHGHLAKIGGTMCHDHYGRPYIVPGSRYVIHYYR